MNQAQIKYFKQRMEELRSEKEMELRMQAIKKQADITGVRNRALAYIKKHRQEAAQDLYAIALHLLSAHVYNPHIDFSPDSDDTTTYCPDFVKACFKEYQAEQEKIVRERQTKEAVLHAKFTALMDKFYLSSCPDCAAIMKELRELSL